MNNVRSVLIGLVGLLLTTQLAFVSSASAQTSTEAERARLNRVMDANTNIEEFRQELTNYFTELEDAVRLYDAIPAVHRKYVKSGLRPMEMLAETKAKIAQISSEELSKMRTIYAGFTGWREAPRAAAALLKPELRGMLDTKLAVQQNGSPSPAFVTPDDCALAIATDVSNSDIAIAKGFEIAAETVMESLPTDFLSFEAHAVAAVARGVLQAISLGLETSKSIKDDCTALSSTDVQSIVTTAKTDIINNDNGNATTIVNNDNSNKVMILTNLDTKTTTITTAITNAKTDIVNNDNANKAMIVDSGNAGTTALSDLILRSQIEANLAIEHDDDEGGGTVAWYMTPTANGGKLDLVQSIVTLTLANIRAAGGSIGNAQTYLNRANADKAAGNFKSAYRNYRKAYQKATD